MLRFHKSRLDPKLSVRNGTARLPPITRFELTDALATQLYLRYDGEIGSGTDNHAVNLGVRLTW